MPKLHSTMPMEIYPSRNINLPFLKLKKWNPQVTDRAKNRITTRPQTTSALTLATNCKLTTFMSAAKYLLEPKGLEVISPFELISVSLRQKRKTKRSHVLACQIFTRTSCITKSYFSHFKWPLVAVAESLERPIWSDELHVSWFKPWHNIYSS